MKLGIFLPLGESLTGMQKSGQDVRFVNYYLKSYAQNFDEILVFTYKKETYANLPKNCRLIAPAKNKHRYLYGFLLPFEHKDDLTVCDVIRCFHPSSTLPALVAKLFFNLKFVFNYNYDYLAWAKIENKSYLLPFMRLMQFLAFKASDFVFVADEKMQKVAAKYKTNSKIAIIRNGVDPDKFKKQSIRNAAPMIFSVGRLEAQKNYLQLIEAVGLIKQQPKLLIVGNGALKDSLMAKAAHLRVNLEIIDVVPNSKLPGFYSRASIYVQPSLIEAPVKTLLEAMSCECACVATNVAGISDVIHDGQDGLLAELDAHDLSEKLAYLLTRPDVSKKLGQAARTKIVEKYNLINFLKLENKILTSL